MPWYALIYAGFLLVVTAGSIVMKQVRGYPPASVFGTGLSGVCALVAFCAYYVPQLSKPLGLWLLVPLVFSAGWEALTYERDFLREAEREEIPEEDRSRLSLFAMIFTFALLAPAWFYGLRAAFGKTAGVG